MSENEDSNKSKKTRSISYSQQTKKVESEKEKILRENEILKRQLQLTEKSVQEKTSEKSVTDKLNELKHAAEQKRKKSEELRILADQENKKLEERKRQNKLQKEKEKIKREQLKKQLLDIKKIEDEKKALTTALEEQKKIEKELEERKRIERLEYEKLQKELVELDEFNIAMENLLIEQKKLEEASDSSSESEHSSDSSQMERLMSEYGHFLDGSDSAHMELEGDRNENKDVTEKRNRKRKRGYGNNEEENQKRLEEENRTDKRQRDSSQSRKGKEKEEEEEEHKSPIENPASNPKEKKGPGSKKSTQETYLSRESSRKRKSASRSRSRSRSPSPSSSRSHSSTQKSVSRIATPNGNSPSRSGSPSHLSSPSNPRRGSRESSPEILSPFGPRSSPSPSTSRRSSSSSTMKDNTHISTPARISRSRTASPLGSIQEINNNKNYNDNENEKEEQNRSNVKNDDFADSFDHNNDLDRNSDEKQEEENSSNDENGEFGPSFDRNKENQQSPQEEEEEEEEENNNNFEYQNNQGGDDDLGFENRGNTTTTTTTSTATTTSSSSSSRNKNYASAVSTNRGRGFHPAVYSFMSDCGYKIRENSPNVIICFNAEVLTVLEFYDDLTKKLYALIKNPEEPQDYAASMLEIYHQKSFNKNDKHKEFEELAEIITQQLFLLILRATDNDLVSFEASFHLKEEPDFDFLYDAEKYSVEYRHMEALLFMYGYPPTLKDLHQRASIKNDYWRDNVVFVDNMSQLNVAQSTFSNLAEVDSYAVVFMGADSKKLYSSPPLQIAVFKNLDFEEHDTIVKVLKKSKRVDFSFVKESMIDASGKSFAQITRKFTLDHSLNMNSLVVKSTPALIDPLWKGIVYAYLNEEKDQELEKLGNYQQTANPDFQRHPELFIYVSEQVQAKKNLILERKQKINKLLKCVIEELSSHDYTEGFNNTQYTASQKERTANNNAHDIENEHHEHIQEEKEKEEEDEEEDEEGGEQEREEEEVEEEEQEEDDEEEEIKQQKKQKNTGTSSKKVVVGSDADIDNEESSSNKKRKRKDSESVDKNPAAKKRTNKINKNEVTTSKKKTVKKQSKAEKEAAAQKESIDSLTASEIATIIVAINAVIRSFAKFYKPRGYKPSSSELAKKICKKDEKQDKYELRTCNDIIERIKGHRHMPENVKKIFKKKIARITTAANSEMQTQESQTDAEDEPYETTSYVKYAVNALWAEILLSMCTEANFKNEKFVAAMETLDDCSPNNSDYELCEMLHFRLAVYSSEMSNDWTGLVREANILKKIFHNKTFDANEFDLRGKRKVITKKGKTIDRVNELNFTDEQYRDYTAENPKISAFVIFGDHAFINSTVAKPAAPLRKHIARRVKECYEEEYSEDIPNSISLEHCRTMPCNVTPFLATVGIDQGTYGFASFAIRMIKIMTCCQSSNLINNEKYKLLPLNLSFPFLGKATTRKKTIYQNFFQSAYAGDVSLLFAKDSSSKTIKGVPAELSTSAKQNEYIKKIEEGDEEEEEEEEEEENESSDEENSEKSSKKKHAIEDIQRASRQIKKKKDKLESSIKPLENKKDYFIVGPSVNRKSGKIEFGKLVAHFARGDRFVGWSATKDRESTVLKPKDASPPERVVVDIEWDRQQNSPKFKIGRESYETLEECLEKHRTMQCSTDNNRKKRTNKKDSIKVCAIDPLVWFGYTAVRQIQVDITRRQKFGDGKKGFTVKPRASNCNAKSWEEYFINIHKIFKQWVGTSVPHVPSGDEDEDNHSADFTRSVDSIITANEMICKNTPLQGKKEHSVEKRPESRKGKEKESDDEDGNNMDIDKSNDEDGVLMQNSLGEYSATW